MGDSQPYSAQPRAKPVRAESPVRILLAGALALAVAMGIGRFAFTPLLPLMLRDRVVDLPSGSALATANYLGYLLGALLCMGLPARWSGAFGVRAGLAATVVLTLGMAVHAPSLWPLLRFLAGVASALAFVSTSSWCLARLAQLGRPALGGAIYTGPAAGIVLSGLMATALIALDGSSALGWLAFGALAFVLTVFVWPVFHRAVSVSTPPPGLLRNDSQTAPAAETALFAVAYGLAGFGYIVTATFLPVIARAALPGSLWLDLFWPILGVATFAGALLATRVPVEVDPRLVLIGCYLLQALGVVFALFVPTVAGFVAGSLLVGLPFTAITYFAMQEARRLRPHQASRLMGLLSALYGIGQVLGPPVAAWLVARAATTAQGFALALSIASAMLVLGAVLFGAMLVGWPPANDSARR